jgi:hypothetical protein
MMGEIAAGRHFLEVLRICRSRFSFALRWCGLFLGLRFLYALLERLHKVNDLCTLWRFWGCNRDLSATLTDHQKERGTSKDIKLTTACSVLAAFCFIGLT